MSSFRFQEDVYITVTPGGAYYAATTPEQTLARTFLLHLLSLPHTPKAADPGFLAFGKTLEEEEFYELVYRVQRAGWIKGEAAAGSVPAANMERDLPALLQELSSERRAILADMQGFLLTAHGFTHEAAEEIAILAADVASISRRYRSVVSGNLGMPSSALALVDAAGCSELGFWPLFLGDGGFILVLAGEPRFNQRALVDVIWGLAYRYAKGITATQVS